MEDELFDYGTFKLRKDALIYNINNEKNLTRYIDAHRLNEQDAKAFREAVSYIAKGISNGSITKDLEFVPESGKEEQIQLIDSTGGLSKNNLWHGRAIGYLGRIATAQGNHKNNKKATEVKKKEYQDISTYLAKSLYPNATGLTDPNIDWDSFKAKYKGQSHKAAYNILSGFTKSENIDPAVKAKLDLILPKLIDQDGITADDKLELNKAGITGLFISFLDKMLNVTDPKGGNAGLGNGLKGVGQENGKKDDNPGGDTPPAIIPEPVTPVLNRQVANASLATVQGDWYIEGRDANRKKWVLWNNEFQEVPMSFIYEDYFKVLRNLLKTGYKNRYLSENMEDSLNKLRDYINLTGMKKNYSVFDRSNPAVIKIYNLIKNLGNPKYYDRHNEDYTDLLWYIHSLSDDTEYMYSPKKGLDAVFSFGSFKKGGIIKADGGTLLKYNPKNELYKSLYRENAKSIGLAGANNSLRSSNLKFNKTYTDNLNLNDYYKQFKLYENPEDRHKDFLTWADKNYLEGDTITTLLDKYNDGIDTMYQYKQTDDSQTYALNGSVYKSQNTANFNTKYNDWYSGANSRVFGYDPNSVDIAGSATMGRHPDITDDDIAMDFSKHEITKEGLKKLLTENKITKTKTGHYTYASPSQEDKLVTSESTEVQGTGNESRVTGGGETEKLPEKEEQLEIPGETSKLKTNLPFIAAGLYDAYKTNAKINDLAKQMPEAYLEPINLHRNVYGNLRALAEANRKAGLRNALARQLMTADGSFNAALMMDTFNKNIEDWQNALAVDDLTQRETSEKAYQELKEAYLKNHDIFWGNTQTAVLGLKEDIVSDMAKEPANHQSRKNALDEYKTYLLADITKRDELNISLSLNRLWNHIQQSPVSYIGGWTLEDLKLWNRYLANETITDPAERQKLLLVQNLMNDIYLQKRFPNAKFKMPSMNNIRLMEPVYDANPTVPGGRKGMIIEYINKNKGGGKITNDLVKAIIQYLKESNKNYNKAIDRSVKGLYNSIKLQKERKK